MTETPTTISSETVLPQVSRMIDEILDGYGVEDLEIGMDTSFHDDLEMESIDLVTLAGMLSATFGPRVNLAEFLADKDLEEVIELTIGDIVRYVTSRIQHT